MSRRSHLLVALLALAVPATARAQITFTVHQDLGTLPAGLGPYFLVWSLGDNNPAQNSVTISNFSSTNLSFVATPNGGPPTGRQNIYDPLNLYDAGGTAPVPTGNPAFPNIVNPEYQYYDDYLNSNSTAFADVVFGSVTTAGIGPGNPTIPTVFLFEDPVFQPVTSGWQQIVGTGGPASIDFTVTVSNYFDPNFPADTFVFNLAYTDSSALGSALQIGDPNYTIDVQTTGTGKGLVVAELTDTFNYTNVESNSPDTSGGNVNVGTLVTAGLTASVVQPEPGTMVIWGVVFGVGGLVYRRRKMSAALKSADATTAA